MNIGDIAVYREEIYLGEFDGYDYRRHDVVVLQVFQDTFGVEKALVYCHSGDLEVFETSELELMEDND